MTHTTDLLKGAGSFHKKFLFHYSLSLRKKRKEHIDECKFPNLKGLEDIGHMDEKVKEMGRELSSLRDKEAMMKA